MTDWKKLSDTIGKDVKVKTIGKTYCGKAEDIDEDCSLIIRLSNNKTKKIVEGDVFY